MNELGTVVLSIDDGRNDLITNIVPLLEKYSLPATFNITTGYIDGSLMPNNRFCENEPASLANLLKLRDNELFEIASHGDQHLNSVDDLRNSIFKLKNWGLIENKCGFGSPGHGMESMTDEQIQQIRKQLDLEYIRIGTRLKNNLFSKMDRWINAKINIGSGFRRIYSECLNDYQTEIYKCIPYNKRININRIKDMALLAGTESKVLILLFHSVLKKQEAYFHNIENIDYDLFENLLYYLKELRESRMIRIEKLIDIPINLGGGIQVLDNDCESVHRI